MLSRWVADRDALREMVGPGPIVTWNKSSVEYQIYRSTHSRMSTAQAANLAVLLAASVAASDHPFMPRDSPLATIARRLRRASLHDFRGNPRLAMRQAVIAAELDPGNARARWFVDLYRRRAGQR